MVNEETESAHKQAAEVVGQLEAGRPPALDVAGSDEQLVQVMTPAGAGGRIEPERRRRSGRRAGWRQANPRE